MSERLVLGTRGSALALTQAQQVEKLLRERLPDVASEVRIIHTEGDRDRQSPLSSFGGRGAFVRSIENALIEGAIDVAVHSLKDLPSRLPGGLVLGAAPFREDPRDVLVTGQDSNGLDDLPAGATVATGSDRRRIQFAALRPDLRFTGIRGNVETRLGKLDKGAADALVLASAGLHRLGLAGRITHYFDTGAIIPAPCQGAIGLECREDDTPTRDILEGLDAPDVRLCVEAERRYIAVLGMGCHAPVGAYACASGDRIRMTAFVAREDDNGTVFIGDTVTCRPDDAVTTAESMARSFREAIDDD